MKPEIFESEQGSEEWLRQRMGIPTASEFHTVMAKGKDGGVSVTRRLYMLKLAGEVLTGEPMSGNYTDSNMERGKLLEDEARDFYAFTTNAPLLRVGFIRAGNAGCSPDALVGEDCGLEIKCVLPQTQIDRLLRGVLPPEHKAQVQGNMWIANRRAWDFVSYCPRLPLFVTRVERDDGFIATLAGAVANFNADLAAIVDRINGYGKPSNLLEQLRASVSLEARP